jgi:hypothetical protein
MKKSLRKLRTAVFMAVFVPGMLLAQPVTTFQLSTAENPVWYNINSAATAGANAGMAPAVSATLGNIVKGIVPVSPATVHPDQNKDLYLWRFENDGNGNMFIINKSGLKIDHPATAAASQRVLMNTDAKAYTFTAVAGITTNNVSGTAFYFTPIDAAFAAIGRLNCDGSTKELVLFKASTNGDILQTGGKGSLFWLYEVPMKSVSVSASGTGAGLVMIMNDAGEPEEGSAVSKAQSLTVVVRASANVGSVFDGWKNKTTGEVLSTDAEFSYSGTQNVELEAVFSLDASTSLNNAGSMSLSFYPNPATGMVVCTDDVLATEIYSQSGQLLRVNKGNRFDVSALPVGAYLVKMISENDTVIRKLMRN